MPSADLVVAATALIAPVGVPRLRGTDRAVRADAGDGDLLLVVPAVIALVIYLAPLSDRWVFISLIVMCTLPPTLWALLTRIRVVEDPALRCAHCGYDLRGLPLNDHGNAVCPECSQEDFL